MTDKTMHNLPERGRDIQYYIDRLNAKDLITEKRGNLMAYSDGVRVLFARTGSKEAGDMAEAKEPQQLFKMLDFFHRVREKVGLILPVDKIRSSTEEAMGEPRKLKLCVGSFFLYCDQRALLECLEYAGTDKVMVPITRIPLIVCGDPNGLRFSSLLPLVPEYEWRSIFNGTE